MRVFFPQFRALSDQLYRTPEYHKHVRKEVVKQVSTEVALKLLTGDSIVVIESRPKLILVILSTL